MSIVKKNLLVVLLLFSVSYAVGQAARSPFSTFGIGESYGNALAHNQGMAGVGVAQPQVWNVNNQNPALLVYNGYTMFGAGVIAERRNISADGIKEKAVGGNLNYLVLSFPILPSLRAGEPARWTTSLGLMPFSTVKYKIQYSDVVTNSTEPVDVVEEGTGGITQLYWSNGIKITNDLSVGLKTSYLFSSIVNTYKNYLPNSPQPANFYSAVEEKSYVKDFAFAAGAAYSIDSLFSRNLYRLSFGLTYNFSADLNTNKRDKLYRSTASGDTIESTVLSDRKGSIYLPPALTFGVSLSRGVKWSVGTEFSYQDWSSFKSINKDDEGLDQSWRVALGGEITPDPFAENLLKRMTYRMGFSMDQYPFIANGNKVKDLGINFGLSVPAGRSSLDLGFKLGKRGNMTDTLIEENYFKIYFGITFNDQWFIKRKFD
jgi:hypothetical protein